MDFGFYTKAISKASKNIAAGTFITGLVLIGFGFLIFVLRDLFAILFALIFCIAGIGCITTAIKIFWTISRTPKTKPDDSQGYRENVRIHIREQHEMNDN